MNGEVLKRYNDLSVYRSINEKDETINYEISGEMKKSNEELIYEHSSSIMMPHIDMPKLTNETPLQKVINLNQASNPIENYYTINPKPINVEYKPEFKTSEMPAKLSSNSVMYRFDPNSNFSIQLKPSKDGKFLQRFVNISDIKIQPSNIVPIASQSFRNLDNSQSYHFNPNMIPNNNFVNYYAETNNHYQDFQDPNGLHLVWNPNTINNKNINNARPVDYNSKDLKRKSTSSLNHLVMIQTDKYEQSNYNSQKSINDIVKTDDFYIKKSPKRIKKQSKSIDNSKLDGNETPIPIEIEDPIGMFIFNLHVSIFKLLI